MGPFTKLPENTEKTSGVRSLVLDTVWTLVQMSALQLASPQNTAWPHGESTIDDASMQGLCASVASAVHGTSDESYWSALCSKS
jgi:hypothetical protein